ncbi:hypothetical protein [Actinomadura sp. 6N118]|uniref:hypothetical protein n=1 Tax=Actinomadura sp. 6N118 TaxID=3375151 RepID=UPI00378902B4
MLSKKLFASLTLSAFAVGGAMAMEGVAQASAAETATAVAAVPMCKFKVRNKPARVQVRKAVKKGDRLSLGKPIGYMKAQEMTIGTCKQYDGWHVIGGRVAGKKQVVAGAIWHAHVANVGRA